MAVRSRRFFGPLFVLSGAARSVLYTVPPGRTATVRGLDVTFFGAAATELDLFVNGVPWLIFVTSTRGTLEQPSRLEVVWNPGDVIEGEVGAGPGNWTVTASGSLLLGAPA